MSGNSGMCISLHVETAIWQRSGGAIARSSRLADLIENRPGFRCRVGGFGDGAAYDDVAGSGRDGFRGGGNAGLIAVAGGGWGDARGYDGEIVAQLGAHGGSLVGGGDYALASVVEGNGGQAQHFFAHGSAKADCLQL